MIGVAISAHLAAVYALLTRPVPVAHSTRTEIVETIRTIHLPIPIVVPSPPVVAPVVAPVEARVCPAPNRTATRVTVPAMPVVDRVYASPTNVDWIVAWNDASVYSSTDGGRSFREVLTGEGRVLSAAIDCFGDVLVARGTRVGVLAKGVETWRDVPGIDFTETVYQNGYAEPAEVWIVGGGPDLVVVGFEKATEHESRAAISRDLGRTWSHHDLSEDGFQGGHIAGRQRSDGTVELELEIEDCGGEWMETFTIANGTVTRLEDAITDDMDEAAHRARVVKREPWRDRSASHDAGGRAWVIGCGAPQLAPANDTECRGDE
ncbi:MAG: hypothetical protein ACKV2T_23655 [Kofleriaceae bacterium]